MEQEKQYKTWDGKDWDGKIFREDQKQYTVYIPKYNITVKTGLTDAREIMYQTDIKALKQSRDLYFALGRLGEPKRDFSESIFKQAAKATGNFIASSTANLYGWGKDWLWKGWNEYKYADKKTKKLYDLTKKEYDKTMSDYSALPREEKQNFLQERFKGKDFKTQTQRWQDIKKEVEQSEEYKQFLKENEQKFAEAEKAREEWNIRQRKDLDDFIQKSGLDKNHFDGFTYDLVGGGASAVAALAVGAITKSPAAVAAVFGASAGHDYYTEALAAGLTGNKAMAVGYGAGALEGFFEMFGAEGVYRAATNAKLFKHSINAIIRNARIKLRKQGLKKLALETGTAALEGAVVEGSEEFVQDISTAAIMNDAGVRNDEARQIIIDGFYSAALGAITGGAMAGGGKIGVTTLAYMQKQSIAKRLQQVGFNKENADEIAAEIVDKGYSRETTEAFIKFAESENSKVTYPNGDKEAAAKRFGEQVKELADPAKRAAAAKEMWAIYDKVKEDALAAGLPQMWADFAAKQAEKAAEWSFGSVGMMPKEWYEKNKITFLNDMKTDWEKQGRPEKVSYKIGQVPIDQSLARQVLDGNGETVTAEGQAQQAKKELDELRLEGEVFFQFGGPKAENADTLALGKAKEMEQSGTDIETIRRQTGWFKGADGKWRFEISDKEAEILPSALEHFAKYLAAKYESSYAYRESEELRQNPTKYKPEVQKELIKIYENNLKKANKEMFELGDELRLGDVLKHDKLFKAYPYLRDVKITVSDMDASGSYYPDYNEIVLDADMFDARKHKYNKAYPQEKRTAEIKKVLMHEIQHAIQQKEGFAKGGNPEQFADRAKQAEIKRDLAKLKEREQAGEDVSEEIAQAEFELNSIKEGQTDKYLHLAGEMEARNTERRTNLSEQERQDTPPQDTQDYKDSDAIVVFGGTQRAYHPMLNTVDTTQQVNVVDLSDIPVHGKKDLKNLIQSLINGKAKETTSDGAILNFVHDIFVYKKKNIRINDHLVQIRPFNKKQADIHNKAINDIFSLIKNSVLIAKETAKADKFNYDTTYRFFVPVKINNGKDNGLYTLQLVALHNKKYNSLKIEADIYEVIIEKSSLGTISQTKRDADQGDTISIEEMMSGVKDFSVIPHTDYILKPVINVDGKQLGTRNSDGRQIAHTPQNIANFWNWFGKSKVVDKNGKPLTFENGKDVYIVDGNYNEGFGRYTYKDAHRAPSFDDRPVQEKIDDGGDFSLEEVLNGFHQQPEDYFSANGPRMYMYDDKAGLESLQAINNAAKTKKITVYRTVPNDVLSNEINNGDWITFSKEYAKNHGESRFGKNAYRILQQEVPVKDVWWDGNDIREWGYDNGNPAKKELYLRIENPKYQNNLPSDFKQIRQLRDEGYDGIITPDGKYLVMGKNQIKSVYNRGTFDFNSSNIFFQQDDKSEEDTRLQPSGMTEPTGARGYVEFSTQGAFMHLLENADPSTILHETSGHIQLRNFEKIRDIAETEGASQEFWDIWERVENWLGKAQRIENPDGTVNYRFTREQQEMFAEGMEKMYIAGKAPTTTLQKVFEYFKQMLSDMYEEAREWLDLRPEVEELFGKILAGPQVEDADSKLYKGKAKDIKQVAEKARKGQAATINGLGIKEVKALIKQLSKRRPKMPKDDLFTVLKRKGADYEKAAGIDKEQYENAGIKNKQGGIDDKLALWLKREGFMEFDEDGSYEQDQELEQQAADMIDRALSGETIYRIADLDKVAQVENFDANMEEIRKVFGNNVEQAEETLRAIEDLQAKGYRVIGNSDMEYAERETGKLMSFAEKERMLKAKIEELTKDKEELAEIAERRLIAIGRTQAQAKEEGYKEAIKDAQDEKTVKDLLTVEQEARKNALDAKRVKNALIDELNKRELEGKQEMLKELAAAKSTQDIFTAAQKLMTALHKQYEKTDSAKAEQRKTELPKTDWGRVKLSAIEKFKKIAQQADSDVQRARELDKQASAMRAKGQKPDEKQQAQFDNARGKILKGYGLKFAKAIKEAFYGVEHIDNIWLDKQANMLGAEYARGRNILGAELDRLIERAQKRQTENYKKYIAGKIQKMLEAGYKVKDGQKQKGKYDYATNKLFEDLNALAALDRTAAKKELERRQNIADRGLSDNEAALEVKGLNGDADNVIYAALADNMRLENMYLKFKAGKMNKEEMAAAKESLQAQGLPDNIGTDEWYYVSAQLLSQFYKEVNERRNAALEGRIAQSVLRAQEEEREREQFGEAVRKNGKAGLLKKGYLWWVANWESFINTVANGKFKDKFSLLEEEARAETRTNQKMTEVLQTVKKVLGADNTAVKKWVDSLDDKLITVKNRIESKRKALAESKGKIREKLTVLEQFRKLVSDNDDVVIKNLLSFQDEKGEYRDFNVRLVYDTEAGGLKRIYDGAGIDGVMRAVSVLEKGLLDKYSPTANKYKKDGVILLKNSNDFAAVLKYSERGGKGTYTLIDYVKWDKNGKQTEGYGIETGNGKSGGDTRQQHSGMTEKNNSELKQDETSATNTSPKEGITDVSNNNIPENYTDDSSDKELKREIKKAALAAAANTVNPWLDTIYAPVEQELTRGQIIDIYNTCKNDIGLTRYENQYGIDQLSQMFALLTPQEKQIADLWQKTVEGGYDEVNGVFVRQYGLDMGKPENYWPFSVDRIESKIDMLGSTYREASRPGLTKSRTKGTLVEMKPQNPVEKLYRHYQTAMKYVETAEKVAWLRRILRNSSIQKVMKENFGEDGVKVMYELLDNSTLGAGRNKAQYYADGIMNWLTNNYVKANIALKPSITLKQLISVVNYSENMPAAQWTKGFVDAVINWKDTIDFMMADPYLKARFENGSQNEALMRALAKDFGKNKTVKQLNSWSNILAFNVRLGDIGAIIFGGKPYIDYLMKEKGMSKEEAFKQFRLDTLRSQQASMRSSLSRLQAAEMNWLMRALFAFKNTNNQYVRKCMDAVISYKRGEISGKQLAKTLAIYAVINQYLYVAFGGLGLFAAAGAGFDDDDKNKQMWAEFMLWPAQNFGFLPIIDDAVSQASYKLSNLIFEGKAGPVRNPEQPILKDIYTAVRTLQKDDISFEDVLNAFAPVAQTATGLPVNYGLNAGKAANELYKANLMKSAVMLGGWSEKRAQAVAGEE